MSRIFISYRRDDTAGYAGRLYDQLTAHFDEEHVFMDIDTIEPGLDFVEVIETAVGKCDVLLALIGQRWLTVADANGQRRLFHPEDFVRLEIAAALDRNIRVIPVLVQGASMPRSADLPDVLAKLARRNALELSDVRWKHDIGRLIRVVEKVLHGDADAASPSSKEPLRTSSPPGLDRIEQPRLGEVTRRSIRLITPANIHQLELLHTYKGKIEYVHRVAFDPVGEIIASMSSGISGQDSLIELWRVADAAHLHTLIASPGIRASLAFAPDGLLLASASGNNTVQLWHPVDRTLLYTLTVTKSWDRVWNITFAPKGEALAAAMSDGTIRLWRATDNTFQTFIGHREGVMSAAFSPDGQLLASASHDSTIRLWRTSNATLLRTFTGHVGQIQSVTFSPDGQLLASAGADHTVRLWRTSEPPSLRFWRRDNTPLLTLTGHTKPVQSIAFSPDGQVLASASSDGTIRLWSPTDATLLRTIDLIYVVHSVAFSPDGTKLATGSSAQGLQLRGLK